MNGFAKILFRASSLLAVVVIMQRASFASVDDAQSFALQAAEPYVKQGFQVREDYWGGDLGFGRKESGPAAIIQRERILVLAGNRSRSGEGIRSYLRFGWKTGGRIRQLGERPFRGCARHSKDYRQLLYHRQRGGIAGGTHALGAGVWFPVGQR